jgi:hypothetical protein
MNRIGRRTAVCMLLVAFAIIWNLVARWYPLAARGPLFTTAAVVVPPTHRGQPPSHGVVIQGAVGLVEGERPNLLRSFSLGKFYDRGLHRALSARAQYVIKSYDRASLRSRGPPRSGHHADI